MRSAEAEVGEALGFGCDTKGRNCLGPAGSRGREFWGGFVTVKWRFCRGPCLKGKNLVKDTEFVKA